MKNPLAPGEYERCTFTGCEFGEANLCGYSFWECEFAGCNLSLAKLDGTALREVVFRECKMLGLHFDECNKFGFGVSFVACTLDHSTFVEMKMAKTSFRDSKLREVDFSGCDLTSAMFDTCDLTRAVFHGANLTKADLSTSSGYTIDPERTLIRKARFSLAGLPGLLESHDIEVTPFR